MGHGRQFVECWCCGRENRPHNGHGLCTTCYHRWRMAGKPRDEAGRPIPGEPSHMLKQARMEDYLVLRDWRQMTRREAAAVLGVTVRTVDRYLKELVAAGRTRPRRSDWYATRS
jgi:hypothetical protein